MIDTMRDGSRTPGPGGPALRRAVVASIIGNGLEWFDFLVYGFFAGVISRTFFPGRDPTLSLVLAWATFAIGFVVRPLGGVLIGVYADRAGRRRALSLLILLMAAGTLAMGMTPGYATIGIAAPLLVVVARMLQGLSVGGEFASATAMLVEYAPPSRRMFYGSLQMCSQSIGVAGAAGCAWLLAALLGHSALESWAWRLPFLLGAIVGPVGYYIRRGVAESPEYLALERSGAAGRATLGTVLRRDGIRVVSAMGLIVGGTAATYIWNTYLPVYAARELHMAVETPLLGTALVAMLDIAVFPLAGILADRVGAYRVFYTAALALGLSAWPLFAYLVAAPGAGRLHTVQLVAGLLLGFLSGPVPGMLARLFPTEVRSTGMAIAYNLAVTLFGGLAPLIVTGLIAATGDRTMPGLYLAAASLVALAMVTATRPAWQSAPACSRL